MSACWNGNGITHFPFVLEAECVHAAMTWLPDYLQQAQVITLLQWTTDMPLSVNANALACTQQMHLRVHSKYP